VTSTWSLFIQPWACFQSYKIRRRRAAYRWNRKFCSVCSLYLESPIRINFIFQAVPFTSGDMDYNIL